MKRYKNLTVNIDPASKAEVHYSYMTKHATITAQTPDDVERGIADLEARGVLCECAADEMTDDEWTAAFDHASDTWITDDTKAEALRLIRLYAENELFEPGEIAMANMSGFIKGMNESKWLARQAAERGEA